MNSGAQPLKRNVANFNGIFGALGRACLTVLLCLVGPLTAVAGDGIDLRPVDARYRVVVSGIPVGMEARVELASRPQSEIFDIAFSIDHPVLKHHETSAFTWQECSARPYHYSYQSKGFGISRGGQVLFDWPSLRATGNDEPYVIPPGTVDAISLAMMARCQLAIGEQALEFDVAEPQGLRHLSFRVVGRELLDTPAGKFDTIKVERIYRNGGRRTYMWAAPALEYFMIRMEHIENPLVRGKIELTSIDWLTDDVDAETAGEQAHAGTP